MIKLGGTTRLLRRSKSRLQLDDSYEDSQYIPSTRLNIEHIAK